MHDKLKAALRTAYGRPLKIVTDNGELPSIPRCALYGIAPHDLIEPDTLALYYEHAILPARDIGRRVLIDINTILYIYAFTGKGRTMIYVAPDKPAPPPVMDVV